jgi:hypothetical protein
VKNEREMSFFTGLKVKALGFETAVFFETAINAYSFF